MGYAQESPPLTLRLQGLTTHPHRTYGHSLVSGHMDTSTNYGFSISWNNQPIGSNSPFSIMANTTSISRTTSHHLKGAPIHYLSPLIISPHLHISIGQNFSNGSSSAAVMRPNFSSSSSSTIYTTNLLH
jgi:CCR4-NOT transcriptional regulation complex NOT5 subunit